MENETDRYIKSFPEEVQTLLNAMRTTITSAAPEATEAIKYGMPTLVFNGNLVHYAAFKNHIGFYPTPSGLRAFIEEVSEYKNSKGAVQFPLNKPLPLELVTKIVKFRLEENRAKGTIKTK